MAYALNCLNNGYVSVPTITGGVGAGRICRFDLEVADISSTNPLFGNANTSASSNDTFRLMSATQVQVRAGGQTAAVITIAAGSIPLNTRIILEVFKTSAPAIEVRVNGSTIGSASVSSLVLNQSFSINYLFAGGATNRFRGKVYEADILGSQFLNSSEPNASTWGVGTLVDFPTNGTQWIEYASADVDPPTFTVAPAASAIGQTSATITATINETGSIFWVAVPQGDATPSVAQVIAGQNAAGGAPIDAGSAVATTSLSEVASGFTAATDYKFCVVAQDDEPTPNVQAAVTVVNFTTASAGDTTPPVFTVAPAVASVSQTTATVSATIDETGSIFWVVVPDAESTPSVAQVIAGQNAAGGTPTDAGSAVGTTTLSEGVTGMTASTAYKACFVARDDEGVPNVQATVTTVGFTTAAVPTGTITLTDLSSNAGVLWSSQSGITVDVYDPSSGALVVRKTGLTSTAGGDLDVSDAAIVAGTSYNVFITIGSAIGAVKVTAA